MADKKRGGIVVQQHPRPCETPGCARATRWTIGGKRICLYCWKAKEGKA